MSLIGKGALLVMNSDDYKPIMSVKEARKLLGKDYKDRSDADIERIVQDTHELAKLTLDMFEQQNNLLKRLLQFMSDINYYKKYPTRRYLRESLASASNVTEKLEVLLRDTLLQQELYPNYSEIWRDISMSPLGYVQNHMPEALK